MVEVEAGFLGEAGGVSRASVTVTWTEAIALAAARLAADRPWRTAPYSLHASVSKMTSSGLLPNRAAYAPPSPRE